MSKTLIQPYLMFGGRCDEALEFYQRAIGAEVQTVMRFSESPEPPEMPLPPGWDNKVMHAAFKVGESLLMCSDGMSTEVDFKGITLALSLPMVEEVGQKFNALAEGGKIEMPLRETFYSPKFGMLSDRFGIGWMLLVYSDEQDDG
ncbi:VOC family protein [Stratiformator vulcanicus]|uniref:PhnB-like domain-containing protein n=1 Tax=Stratiformator vulcanicus TaxID=2527980 RepID=A0A517R3N3_9PLAN|nr:VOC family protein [Stratiformator vulcanicus]QDT38450.1 hypothetical protein Pan189_28440 [Stratiformator vulcanicus]